MNVYLLFTTNPNGPEWDSLIGIYSTLDAAKVAGTLLWQPLASGDDRQTLPCQRIEEWEVDAAPGA